MRRRTEAAGAFNVWPAFTDVLGGLVVVLIFLITVFVIGEVLIGREISGKDTAIVHLARIVESLEDLLGETEDTNEQLQSRVAGLESSLADRERQLKEYRQILTDAEQTEAQLEQRLAIMAEEREALRGDLATQKSTLDELSLVKDELDWKAADAERQVALLNKQIKYMVLEMQRLNRALTGTQAQLSASETALAEKEGALGNAKQRITALEADAGQAKSQMAQQNRLISQQQSRIEELDRLIKRRLVERVEELEQYSSDFFGRLRQVFADNPDIKVEGDRFVFQSEVLFPSGEAELSGTGEGDLDKFVEVYRQVEAQIPKDLPVIIEIQGHTDKIPIRTAQFASNWELSTHRALGVVKYLIEKGIPPNRLAAVGMGEYHPIVRGDDPSAFRKNRRIELKITSR